MGDTLKLIKSKVSKMGILVKLFIVVVLIKLQLIGLSLMYLYGRSWIVSTFGVLESYTVVMVMLKFNSAISIPWYLVILPLWLKIFTVAVVLKIMKKDEVEEDD